MKISIIYKYKKNFLSESGSKKIFKDSIKNITGIIAVSESIDFGLLNIVFCGSDFIRRYNKEYLGHDYETDIITFHDKDENGLTEGELLISINEVDENSKKFKVSFENELMRVIIHGLMHLCGYRDKTLIEKKIMRQRENQYLKILKSH